MRVKIAYVDSTTKYLVEGDITDIREVGSEILRRKEIAFIVDRESEETVKILSDTNFTGNPVFVVVHNGHYISACETYQAMQAKINLGCTFFDKHIDPVYHRLIASINFDTIVECGNDYIGQYFEALESMKKGKWQLVDRATKKVYPQMFIDSNINEIAEPFFVSLKLPPESHTMNQRQMGELSTIMQAIEEKVERERRRNGS